MKISNRKIGINYPPLIIAEIGINHGGSLDVAKKMVLAASNAGCEIVKHQTHIVEDEMTEEAKNIFPPNADISIWDVMQKYSLSLEDEIKLKSYVEDLGMIYISTPFSRAAAEFLNDIDVPAFKIGSGECNHLPLIKLIASYGKPVIMSTGMQTIESLKPSINILEESGIDYCLLECTNLYPSPPEIVSLQGINELRINFPNALVGFSDHSIGPYMALSSVALGACIIERHFTDTMYRVGPDISCSMDPKELSFLINTSKEIWVAANNSKKRSNDEDAVYKFARGSIVADIDLKCGEVIDEKKIWARRPGDGEIGVENFYDLIGKKINKDITKNTQIKWSDLID